MMLSGKAIYKQRELVLLPFPFSDLTSAKVRPATYPNQSTDIGSMFTNTSMFPRVTDGGAF